MHMSRRKDKVPYTYLSEKISSNNTDNGYHIRNMSLLHTNKDLHMAYNRGTAMNNKAMDKV